MFTGIVQELGTVSEFEQRATGARIEIACHDILADLQIGASIAVNGCCLTAVEISERGFISDVAPETLSRTNLSDLRAGSTVNLERPLSVSARLDGHFVLGHVDGTAKLLSLDALGEDNWWLKIQLPPGLDRYVVSKGSIAVDGISLTVASIEGDVVAFTVIPHTHRNTTLGHYQPSARLNIEVDILAKHLEKLTTMRM
ncbi:MAG TPA: riboflavin synthase [Bryobacteraceae bacterium]|nr:riboflavin synthase [Bryobacteraceae bacterium]